VGVLERLFTSVASDRSSVTSTVSSHLSLCTPCRHTASSQYGTTVPMHTMQAHSQQPVWYCCPHAHHAGTQPAASMVLLSPCTPCRHTASSQDSTAVPVHTMQAHSSSRGADPPTLNLNTMNTSCFVTRERATSIHRRKSWVDPRAGVDAAGSKSSTYCQNHQPLQCPLHCRLSH